MCKMVRVSSQVTPCMGVWIETHDDQVCHRAFRVTPCMGVWIETQSVRTCDGEEAVTPCMGVWIETPFCLYHIYER